MRLVRFCLYAGVGRRVGSLGLWALGVGTGRWALGGCLVVGCWVGARGMLGLRPLWRSLMLVFVCRVLFWLVVVRWPLAVGSLLLCLGGLLCVSRWLSVVVCFLLAVGCRWLVVVGRFWRFRLFLVVFGVALPVYRRTFGFWCLLLHRRWGVV